MKEIIERLKNEKRELRKEYIGHGNSDGLKWARDASYEELLYATQYTTCEDVMRNNCLIVNLDPTRDEILGDYFEGAMEHYERFKYGEQVGSGYIPNEFYRAWETGWKEGVLDFWQRIEPDLG